MSELVDAISVEDLPPGRCTEATVGGKAIAIFNVEGHFHALSNRCAHRGGPLGQGTLDGRLVICPWHAWAFDVTTGASELNPEISVQKHRLEVRDGRVLVGLD